MAGLARPAVGTRTVIRSHGREVIGVADPPDHTRLLVAIANIDYKAAAELLDAAPSLATATLARRDEFFIEQRLTQVYKGDPGPPAVSHRCTELSGTARRSSPRTRCPALSASWVRTHTARPSGRTFTA
jgi:hypothetical protein